MLVFVKIKVAEFYIFLTIFYIKPYIRPGPLYDETIFLFGNVAPSSDNGVKEPVFVLLHKEHHSHHDVKVFCNVKMFGNNR